MLRSILVTGGVDRGADLRPAERGSLWAVVAYCQARAVRETGIEYKIDEHG